MRRRIWISAGLAALVSGAIWMVKQRDAERDAPGRVTLKSSGGAFDFHKPAPLPDWVPVYPGSSPEGVYSDSGSTEARHTYSFQSADAPDKVAAYFQDRLEHAGFRVTPQLAPGTGGLVSAQTEDKKRSVTITVTGHAGATQASVMAVERK